MTKTLWLMLLSLSFTTSALAKDALSPITEAADLLGRDPAKAIELVDPIIERAEKQSDKNTVVVCEVVPGVVAALTTGQRKIVLGPDFCEALFIKGFSLIDLHRGSEAEPFLRRATELAPSNAHYLNAYAEWWKSARQWQKSYDLFAKAADLAPKEAADVRNTRHARSLRGMGFNLIELGKLDEAEALMNESLKLEPDSQAARNELAYIAEQRAKAAKH